MTFAHALEQLVHQTLTVSLPGFATELAICATILVLLLGRLLNADRWVGPRWIALGGAAVAFGIALFGALGTFGSVRSPAAEQVLFGGMLVEDPLTIYMRALLTGLLLLMCWLCAISGIPDREDAPDFHCLLFGSAVGTLLMAESRHLVMLFLSIEMASVPGYMLVGFLKGRRESGEAALKYLVFGAGAAGILLYGASLLAGALGTAILPEMAGRVSAIFGSNPGTFATALERSILLGTLLVLVGLFFKLAIVPFHFWCPDAFEGAPAEVAGFLSVAPKAAAFALLIRFLDGIVGAQTMAAEEARFALGIALAVISAATMTLGNLAAFAQQNVKRLFAYSTIAHAGYMLMAIAAWMVAGEEVALWGIEGLLYYLVVYVFMNLGAFGLVALIRNVTFRETIAGYHGLGSNQPVLAAGMGICCVSLIGIWPTAGFIGKFMVFAATMDAGWHSTIMWALLGLAVVNTVWSVFYYARLFRAMYQPAGESPAPLPVTVSGRAGNGFAIAISVGILALGIFVEPISQAASFVARSLLP